jgi:hypothetical protein
MIPKTISILDTVSDIITKATNTQLENEIDKLVKIKLAKKIKIPVSSKTSTINGGSIEYRNFYA